MNLFPKGPDGPGTSAAHMSAELHPYPLDSGADGPPEGVRDAPTAPIQLSATAAAWTPNPLAGAASRHTATWLDGYSVRTPRAERYATLAAWVYPTAPLADLELASDISAFFRVFDDFTDAIGAELSAVHRVCQELTGVLYGTLPTTIVGRMFRDLWYRQHRDMPDGWTSRAVRHWEWYFATQVPYAAMLDTRAEWTPAEYLELRHGNGAVPICLDLGERARGTFIAPHVYHCTQLRLMRRLASDIIVHCNDVYSSVRDSDQRDPRNLVELTRTRTGCSWAEAVAAIEREMLALNAVLHERSQRLEIQCDLLGFDDADRAQATASATIIHDWNDGYQAWAAANEFLMDTDPPRPAVAAHLSSR